MRRDFADPHTCGAWGAGLSGLAHFPAQADATQVVDALHRTTLTFHPDSTALTGDCVGSADVQAWQRRR